MTRMQEMLQQVKNALLKATDNVGHYEALKAQTPYVVWAEDGEAGSLSGDDKKLQQILEGTIDLFTKEEGDPLIDRIQESLAEARISFTLNSVQYESDTEIIHYEWVWRID